MKKKTRIQLGLVILSAALAIFIAVSAQTLLALLGEDARLTVFVGLILGGGTIFIVCRRLPLMVASALLATASRILATVLAAHLTDGALEFTIVHGVWQTYIVHTVITLIAIVFLYTLDRAFSDWVS